MNKGFVAASAALLMTDGGGGGDASAPGDATGIVYIAKTDAVVDNVTEVWAEFTGVTLKLEQGDEVTNMFDPQKSLSSIERQRS